MPLIDKEKSSRVGKACIYPEVLTMYRIHNSSTTFTRMAESNAKRRYTEYCMHLRRSGMPEISFEKYMQLQKKRPIAVRFSEKYKDYAFYHYKRTVAAIAAKKRSSYLLHGVICAILNPRMVYDALRKKSMK